MRIGTSSGIGFFNGEMDDIRIYNYALSSEEVNALYNENSLAGKNLAGKENSELLISLYPNPSHDIINISSPNFVGGEKVEIIDTNGATVLHKELKSQNSIDISNLSTSMYFIKITNASGLVDVKKFFVN